jgi:hypothetical protein
LILRLEVACRFCIAGLIGIRQGVIARTGPGRKADPVKIFGPAIFLAWSISLIAQSWGVQPLTPASLNEALAVTSVSDISIAPYAMALKARGRGDPQLVAKVKDAPFFITLTTPFTRAATAGLEA